MSKNVVYAKSEEKYAKAVVIYADADDGHVFYDAGKSVKIPKAELENLFMKRCLVHYNNAYHAPARFKDNGADASVVIVDDTSNYTFYSAEHGA